MRRALVTGAAGFIGGALATRLEAEGVEVRGVDARADPERDVVAGDVTRPGAWQAAAEGCDTVFHTAAAVTNAAARERGWRVNVLGTRNVIDAARSAGARRLVHFSSCRAYGDLDFPDGVTEEYPVRPDGSVYVDTKVASEQVALQAHAAGEVEVTIIRPGDVYGPGSRPWTLLIIEAIRNRLFLLPAMGRGIFSPAYIDNLVDGVILAASRPEGAGHVFMISDGVGVTTSEFFGHYYRMLGRRGPRVLPTAAAVALAALPEGVAALTGRETEIRRESMRYLARGGSYSIEKARERLGYQPVIDLDEGMRRTELWLRAEGLLD